MRGVVGQQDYGGGVVKQAGVAVLVLTAPDVEGGSAADFPESLIREGRLSMRLLASGLPDLMLLCCWKGTQNL